MDLKRVKTGAIIASITNTKENTFLVTPVPFEHKTASNDDAAITRVKITFHADDEEIKKAFKKDDMRIVLLYNDYTENNDNDTAYSYVIYKTDSKGYFEMGNDNKIEGSVKNVPKTYNEGFYESDIEDNTVGVLVINADNMITMERLTVNTKANKAGKSRSPSTFVCDIPDSKIKASDINKRNLQIVVSGFNETQKLGSIRPVFEFT